MTATNNLTVLGSGPITFAAAQETDTSSGKSSSFGVSLGVSAGIGLSAPGADGAGGGKLGFQAPSVNFGISGSKGSFSGTDVTNREATLSAGGTATIGTPGALTLDGATLSAKRVEIDAGSLAIASRQDTSTFASKDKSAGVNVSVTFAGQVSASGNLSVGKQSGDFASVETQAGIRAGEGGFGIRVAGATDLKGAVIASTADAARNSLTTGTLTASALENRETFKATSTSIGAGLGNIGQSRTGQTTTDGTGTKPAGLATPLGNLSATPPTALSASGSQASTTVSAIASGGITVTSGDTASLGVAQTISRDTSAANDALTKQFTDAKRNEINQGFEATRQLVSEVGTFFANRGREEADLNKQADEAKARGDTTEETRLRAEAKKVGDTFGSGSAIRIAATAFTAAAGSNVTGGLGSFAQAAAVNVLQSLAASKVKDIADNIQGDRQTQESVRAALQAVVGCAGSVAGGSGGCGDAAIGAAASVVINNLITSASITPRDTNGDGVIDPLTTEEQQARVNIVTTLIAALATGAGLDAQIATTAATIETENNKTRNYRLANGAVARIADAGEGLTVAQLVRRYGIDNHPDLRAISRAYGTRDTAELQAIVNLIADGQSGTEIRAARAAASEAFGQGTAEARAAFVDIGNGRTTTAEVQARADANRVTVSSSGIFNNSLLNSALLGSNPFLTCVTCTVDAQGNIRFLTAQELLAGGRSLLNNLGENIAYVDANYGRVVTRGLGVLQAGEGVFDVIAGGTTAVVAGAACPVTGVSCFVSAGGGAVALIGIDNFQAGVRTGLFGEYTPTYGAGRIADFTGISVENADLLYGFSTFGIGTAQGALRRFTLRGVANAEAEAALAAARAEAARTGDSLAARADAEAGGASPVTANGTANAATGERLTDDLLARMVNPTVSDPELANFLNRLNRPTGVVGNGSTAAAVREELRSGLTVNGRNHIQKAENAVVYLQDSLRRTNLSANDRRTIENVIRDLRNALGGN